MPSSTFGPADPPAPLDGLSFAPMEARHLDDVTDIEAQLFPSPWPRSVFVKEILNPQAVNRVAERGGRVIGYAACWNVARELQIHNLAVAPHWQRHGVGRWLLVRLLRTAVRLRCHAATLEVRVGNAAARRLYRSAGFEEVGRRPGYYEREQEDAVLMTRRLPARWPRSSDTISPMSRIAEVRQRLVREDTDFRRLHDKHTEYERRLEELAGLRYLTAEEQAEESRLKKLKLAVKDQMEEIVRGAGG